LRAGRDLISKVVGRLTLKIATHELYNKQDIYIVRERVVHASRYAPAYLVRA